MNEIGFALNSQHSTNAEAINVANGWLIIPLIWYVEQFEPCVEEGIDNWLQFLLSNAALFH